MPHILTGIASRACLFDSRGFVCDGHSSSTSGPARRRWYGAEGGLGRRRRGVGPVATGVWASLPRGRTPGLFFGATPEARRCVCVTIRAAGQRQGEIHTTSWQGSRRAHGGAPGEPHAARQALAMLRARACSGPGTRRDSLGAGDEARLAGRRRRPLEALSPNAGRTGPTPTEAGPALPLARVPGRWLARSFP